MKYRVVMYLITAVLVLLVLYGLILALMGVYSFATLGTQKYPTPEPSEMGLSEAITRYKTGEVDIIDLSRVTTYSWDRVYIFGPYSEDSEIAAIAGRSWRDSCFTTIAGSDGVTLLLFTRQNRAVGCIEFPRSEADFAGLTNHETGFAPQEAKFILNERGDAVWIGDK